MSPHATQTGNVIALSDLLTPIEADVWPDVPDVNNHDQLLALHRQLLESAQLGPEFLVAAALVFNLFRALERTEPGSAEGDWALASTVVTHVIDALRAQPTRPMDDLTRFDVADGWLEHLSMHIRTRRINDRAKGSDK